MKPNGTHPTPYDVMPWQVRVGHGSYYLSLWLVVGFLALVMAILVKLVPVVAARVLPEGRRF